MTDTGEITTSNGAIEGDFCCTESLELKANNGPINVSITLTSSDPGKPAQLSMTTSNGYVALVLEHTQIWKRSTDLWQLDHLPNSSCLVLFLTHKYAQLPRNPTLLAVTNLSLFIIGT